MNGRSDLTHYQKVRFDLEYVCTRASGLLPDGDPRLARLRSETETAQRAGA